MYNSAVYSSTEVYYLGNRLLIVYVQMLRYELLWYKTYTYKDKGYIKLMYK